jgi:hypothetical protein
MDRRKEAYSCEGSRGIAPRSRTPGSVCPSTPHPLSGQVPYLGTIPETKVFCFFSSEKKKDCSFSEEKAASALQEPAEITTTAWSIFP